MGILNVTPDSFSDGGRYLGVEKAVTHGFRMAEAGADLVDVGGESTRPHAARVPMHEEIARVLPVVRRLAAGGVTVSVDTMRARVAELAVDAGAWMVNDVSGGLADPAMAGMVAATGVPYVVMHWRAPSSEMTRHATYRDVVADVVSELDDRLHALIAAGVEPGQIVLDPGLGFAKTAEHNWALLTNLEALQSLGCPILVGASRKSFLGLALTSAGAQPPPHARDAATLAVSTLAAAAGARCVRVHDVAATRDAVRIAALWKGDSSTRESHPVDAIRAPMDGRTGAV